ncbi:MAG: TetR/AcrR family transcriptional regulator [Lachnospiraceae bacterium]|nr:TetR/AcrR family transcriptional regulator [Lachnospiraceae bacterium]
MSRKSTRNTRGKIISAAWKLFYEQGYENTTVEDIVYESGTSKGSFYHYFEGKDALLGTLAYMFDEKYEELMQTMEPTLSSIEKLAYLNRELFAMIDSSISVELLAGLLSSQLMAHGEKHLLDRNRYYFRLLKQIITKGQEDGELRTDQSATQLVRMYAMWERALLYDWCLYGGEYALAAFAQQITPGFLEQFRRNPT